MAKKSDTKQDIRGKVWKPADIIKYQNDTVVSSEVIARKSGTVTIFAFGKDQGLSEHTAPFDALVYILDGEAMITIAGKPLKVKKGDMVIMPARKPHALKAVKKFKMMLVMIR